MKAIATALIAWAVLVQPCARANGNYDAARDFSSTINPNQVWTYGWSSSLLSPIHLYTLTSPMETNGVTFWYDPAFNNGSVSHYPNLGVNTTASPKTDGGALTWQPGQMSLHPGLAGEYSHVLWSSPVAGLVRLNAQFDSSIQAASLTSPTTDVHIFLNGAPLFNGFVLGTPDSAAYNSTFPVKVGDVLDFAIGFGPNGTATSDATAFAARITPVPKPSSVAPSATFIRSDRTTGGAWKGQYGPGYVIANDSNKPVFGSLTLSGAGAFTWTTTQAPQALEKPDSSAVRIASAFYGSPNFTIDINSSVAWPIPIALYFLDWDNWGRVETITIIDPNNPGTALDTRTVSNFAPGQYLVWNITGHVVIQVNRVAGPNAVVSGIFF